MAAAELLVEQGETARAVQYLEDVRKDGTIAPYAEVGLAQIALGHDQQRSGELLTEALRKRWDYRQAHIMMSQFLDRTGQKDQADIHRWAAAAGSPLEPPDPFLRDVAQVGIGAEWSKKRGLSLMAQDRLGEAWTELRQAVDFAPQDVTQQVSLGTVLASMERMDEALVAYRRALEINPRFLKALNLCARVTYLGGDVAGARDLFERVLEIDPNHDPEAIEALFNLSALAPDKAAGAKHLEAALEINPGHVDTLIRLGGYWWSTGRVDQALLLWHRAVRIDPFQADLAVTVADLLLGHDRHREAVDVLRSTGSRAPNHTRLQLLLAWQLATTPDDSLHSPQEALSVAVAAVGEHMLGGDVLAAALAATGRFDAAAAVAGRAVEVARRGHPEAVADLMSRHQRYRSGRAYRRGR